MEKEFVPYELSVKLKELGFDENCLKTMLDFDITYESDVKMPLFQQAFRWFRQKGYRFNVINDVSQVDGDYFYDVWFNGKFLFESHESSNTYEDAELACLTKLIEIVEQQNQK